MNNQNFLNCANKSATNSFKTASKRVWKQENRKSNWWFLGRKSSDKIKKTSRTLVTPIKMKKIDIAEISLKILQEN